MRIRQRSAELVAEIGPAIQRFPIATLAALSFALYFLLGLHRSPSWFDPDHALRIPAALTAAFVWSLAASLYGEARGRSIWISQVFAIAASVLIVLATAVDRSIGFAAGLLIASGLLALSIAPYSSRHAEPRAFWRFNHDLWTAWLASFFAAILFGAGLSAIVESLRYLFGVHISVTAHEKIWAIACGLVGPIYWLSVVPDRFEAEVVEGPPTEFVSRMVALLAKFILVPLILAYAVILHAYAAKIGLDAALPKGRLGWLVLCFGTAVVATVLLIFPTRDASGPLVAFFWRFWPALLAIPLVLLFLAVTTRIGTYGLTEARYIVVIAGVWLIAVTVWFALAPGKRDLRILPATLGLLLAVSSFGPWGFHSWPMRSQIARLTSLLSAAGLLKDGRVVETSGRPGQLTPDSRKQLSSTIDYLNSRRQLHALRPLFAGTQNDPFAAAGPKDDRQHNWQLSQGIKAKLGLTAINQAGQVTLNYHGGTPGIMPIHPGGVMIGPLSLYAPSRSSTQVINGVEGAWTVTLKRAELVVEAPGGASQAVFDLSDLVTGNGPLANWKPADAGKSRPPIMAKPAKGTLSATLVVLHINLANLGTPEMTVSNLSGWLHVATPNSR